MDKYLEKLVHDALKENGFDNSIPSLTFIDNKKEAFGNFIVKTPGIISGTLILEEVFRQINPKIKVNILKKDGEFVNKGDVVASVSGKMLDILRAEKVACNFLQKMSGIATLTDKYVQEVKGTNCTIYDSYNTTPLLREFEQEAVVHGNGNNWFFSLPEYVLIKDFHIQLAGSITEAVNKIRLKYGRTVTIDVETTNEEEYLEASNVDCDIITLENMSLDLITTLVSNRNFDKKIRINSNVPIGKLRTFALLGVEYITFETLSHASKALDIRFKFLKKTFR